MAAHSGTAAPAASGTADGRKAKSPAKYIFITLFALGLAHLTAFPFGLSNVVWLSFAINLAAWVPSAMMQTERFYDLVGAITNTSLAAYSLMSAGSQSTRQKVCCGLILVWALRLGSFLFRRVLKDGHDSRFVEIKQNPVRFLYVWALQGLWCWFNVFCVAILNSPALADYAALPLSTVDYVGLALWVVGFGLEVAADSEKTAFRADPANKGRFISTGVWGWSRHPNYAGEITLWAGLAVVCSSSFAAAGLGPWWFGWWSPCFIALLLTKVSGLPLLEAKAEEKWGGDAAYKAYKESTPVLFPVIYV
jgi:steroid 5-alpha reductase family enzyme